MRLARRNVIIAAQWLFAAAIIWYAAAIVGFAIAVGILMIPAMLPRIGRIVGAVTGLALGKRVARIQ